MPGAASASQINWVLGSKSALRLAPLAEDTLGVFAGEYDWIGGMDVASLGAIDAWYNLERRKVKAVELEYDSD